VLELLEAPYFVRALGTGALVALPLGILGCWVVLRELAFFSHAVGAATFPGLVLGSALPALGPFGGALLAALGFSATISAAERAQRLTGGAVTGLALAAALAGGAVLTVPLGPGPAPVERLLFGSLLAVSGADVARSLVAAAATAGALGLAVPRLAAATFDPGWAEPAGARERCVGVGLVVLLTVVVVCALPAVGSLLAGTLLVVPAATARLFTDRLGPMLLCSATLALAAMVLGLLLARLADLPPGAAVALLAGAGFAVAEAARAADARLARVRAA
jgi:ABC-type Mn2+/Zn2+ transport system permease subunit